MGFPGGSEVKASAWNAGDLGSIPGLEDPLEKEMATHSSTLAWRIPWREEPGGLQSMGSQRVRHDWETSLSEIKTKDLLYSTEHYIQYPIISRNGKEHVCVCVCVCVYLNRFAVY